MKTLIGLILLLSGCSMTPAQRVMVVGGVLVTGYYLSRDSADLTRQCYRLLPNGAVQQVFC